MPTGYRSVSETSAGTQCGQAGACRYRLATINLNFRKNYFYEIDNYLLLLNISISVGTFHSFNNITQQNPISWIFHAKKLKSLVYELRLTAIIAKVWTIRSPGTPDSMTTGIISFKNNPAVFFNGRIQMVRKTAIDSDRPLKNGVPNFYECRRDWVQLVQAKNTKIRGVNGTIEFIAFNRYTRKTLPAEKINFYIPF